MYVRERERERKSEMVNFELNNCTLLTNTYMFKFSIDITLTMAKSGNTNLLVGRSIIVPSTSHQTGLELAVVEVNKKIVV